MTVVHGIQLLWDAKFGMAEFVKRCEDPVYRAKAHTTKIYQGVEEIRRVNSPTPTPTPTPVPSNALGRSWIFMAEEPDRAVNYPAYYGIAFTADSGYVKPLSATLKTLNDRGQRVRAWCDCHSTFPGSAKQMAHDFGLDGWIGEGESSPAFDVAYAAGAEIVVGNLSALTQDRRDQQGGLCWYDPNDLAHSRHQILLSGKVTWINELYLNQDAGRAGREDWMNLPVAGRCIAAYDASGENPGVGTRFPVSEYLSLGKFQSHRDSFYDPGSTDNDRRLLP